MLVYQRVICSHWNQFRDRVSVPSKLGPKLGFRELCTASQATSRNMIPNCFQTVSPSKMWTEAAEWHRICFFQNSFWFRTSTETRDGPWHLLPSVGTWSCAQGAARVWLFGWEVDPTLRPGKVGCHGIFSDWNSMNEVTIEDLGIWQPTPSWSKGLNAEVLEVSWSVQWLLQAIWKLFGA